MAASLALHALALFIAQIAYAPYSVYAPSGFSGVSSSGTVTPQSAARG